MIIPLVFSIVKNTLIKLKNDFIWLKKVILNPNNEKCHIGDIIRLIDLFKLKWGHYKNHPKQSKVYFLYLASLRMALKGIYG